MDLSTYLPILLRAVLLIACWMGVSQTIISHKAGFMNGGGILYYTVQSNIWVMLMTAVYFFLNLASLVTGVALTIPHVLEIARFAVMIAITITFLVFWFLLAPSMEREYLASINNILVHTLVPLLFIADFFLFDRLTSLSASSVLWVTALPLAYLAFTIVHAAVKPTLAFEGGGRYPYFFLDLDKYGWFGSKEGIGVIWWIVIMLALTLGLGYLCRFLLLLI